MRRTAAWRLGLAGILLTWGCQLLPERLAVNAPLRQLLWGGGVEAATPDALQKRLQVADGFALSLYASGLPGARFLRFTPRGDLLVSLPRAGRIVLVARDADGDGRPDDARTLLADLDKPHGLDVHDGWLWVAETGAVGRVRFDAATGTVNGAFTRIVTGLPTGGNHWTRTARIGPDGLLYVSIGSSCNVCVEKDPRRAAIVRYRPDGSGEELYATGLRNAVGFDWRPGTNELFATDNGRDFLGDDFPPCELNRVVAAGFYGWPFANGNRIPDPDLGRGHEDRIKASMPPVHGFRAHNAPLGITFVRGERVPPDYRGAALVALHGSWNRTRKDGYKVVSLHWQPDGRIVERDFVAGFELDENVIGRPVDVAEGPDGAFYVSDDYAGAIYRVAYGQATRRTETAPAAEAAAAARPGEAARGKAFFERLQCAACHFSGPSREGVVPRPLAGLARRFTPESLAAFLAAPTPPMPPVEEPLEARRDLAAHLLATHP